MASMTLSIFSSFQVTTCGLDQLDRHALNDISHVLSILDPGTCRPRALAGFPPDSQLELRFHDVVLVEEDRVPPNQSHVEQILAFGRQAAAVGHAAHLLIHCHAGQSRSTAAATLCLAQAYPIRSGYEVLGEIVRQNPRTWPNLLMLELGDTALGRQGELIAAAATLYRRALDSNPGLGDHMKRHGRAREVELAERWR